MNLKLLFFDFSLPYLIKDSDYPVGGATVEWYAWIKGFIENDVQIGVLTWKGANYFIQRLIKFDLIETYNLNEGIPKLRWIYRRLPSLIRAIKRYNPNFLIQECAGLYTGIMGLISKRYKFPFIYRVANDIEADERYKDRLNILEQFAFRYGLNSADAIFCQNSYQYKKFKKQFPKKKCVKIHNPFYCEQKLPELIDYTERKYIAWIGIFQKQKNLQTLLEVVKRLPNIEFKIAGKSSRGLDKETNKALKDLNMCKNVSFVGYLNRKRILSFLSYAYALLNTSHYEGFSNTFLESFAAGTPIVATTEVDPDNIIANNNLGIVRKDFSELPDALVSIINDKNYNILSRRCKEYLKKNHNPKNLAKEFIENLPTRV
ncbi:MAG: glycosyltransferase family 4 protein [Promethearchaeota archaeon]